jgi:hypothetical protein
MVAEKPQITRMNADELGPDNQRLSALSAVCDVFGPTPQVAGWAGGYYCTISTVISSYQSMDPGRPTAMVPERR